MYIYCAMQSIKGNWKSSSLHITYAIQWEAIEVHSANIINHSVALGCQHDLLLTGIWILTGGIRVPYYSNIIMYCSLPNIKTGILAKRP